MPEGINEIKEEGRKLQRELTDTAGKITTSEVAVKDDLTPDQIAQLARQSYREISEGTKAEKLMGDTVDLAASIESPYDRERAFIEIIEGYGMLANADTTNAADYESEALHALEEIPLDNRYSWLNHIEGLARLYAATNNETFLDLAKQLAKDKDSLKVLAEQEQENITKEIRSSKEELGEDYIGPEDARSKRDLSKDIRQDALIVIGEYAQDFDSLKEAYELKDDWEYQYDSQTLLNLVEAGYLPAQRKFSWELASAHISIRDAAKQTGRTEEALIADPNFYLDGRPPKNFLTRENSFLRLTQQITAANEKLRDVVEPQNGAFKAYSEDDIVSYFDASKKVRAKEATQKKTETAPSGKLREILKLKKQAIGTITTENQHSAVPNPTEPKPVSHSRREQPRPPKPRLRAKM